MSAVVEKVKDVGNAVGDAVSYVGNAVSDVGNFVIDKVVEPVAKAVDNTIQAAIADPIGTAVKIAAISTGNPYIIAAANTGVALAKGADPEDALKAGAKAAVMYEVGSAVGEYVAPEAAAYFGPENAAAAAAVTNAAASTVAAAVVGEDPYQALLASGVNSAAGVIAKQVPGYDSLSANQQRALKTTIAASLEGKDPSQALVNQALQVGIDYVKNDPEIQNIVPASAERKPTTQEEVDALINGGLTEDDGSNYGYEQAPDFAPEIDKKPTEIITAPVDTGTDKPVVDELLPSPPVTDSDSKLSEAQKDYLESSVAGGDDEVISEILNNQLSPLTPGDATPLPPVTGVDLTEENIVPEGVERPPATQEEVDALIDSGLTEDTGIDYGYEQAPDFIPDTSEKLPEAVALPTKDEISDLVDSGLVEDAGLDYGYEQAPDLSPITEGDVSPFPPVTNVDLTQENIVPESVERTPTTQDEVDALIGSGLVEDTGTDYGYEQAAPEEVTAPVDTGLTEDAGLDYGYEQAPDLSPITEGDVSPFPPVTNVDLTAENIVPEGVDRTPTTQDEIDALIDSGLIETAPPVESIEPTAPDSGESLSEVVVTPPPEDDLESLIDSGLVEDDGSNYGYEQAPDSGPTTEDDGSNYGYEQAPDYKPPTGNVVPSKPVITVPPSKPEITVPSRPKAVPKQSANTLDDLMSMMQGAPVTSTEQEELIKLVKASPYFNISNPLDIGFFDVPTNQDPVKMAEGGYMDILFPKTQLTMDEILQILEGKYHG